jgi:hypothetical protein
MGVGGQRLAPASLPPVKRPGSSCTGHQDQPGEVRKFSTPPGFDRRTVQHVASYSDSTCSNCCVVKGLPYAGRADQRIQPIRRRQPCHMVRGVTAIPFFPSHGKPTAVVPRMMCGFLLQSVAIGDATQHGWQGCNRLVHNVRAGRTCRIAALCLTLLADTLPITRRI